LLKILAGLLTPTRGHTNLPSGWRGKLGQWLKRDPGPGRVTYLHQTPYLFDRSVHDNVAWALGHRAADEVRVFEALRRVELESLAREHISILSGGERQRLAMARAWALHGARSAGTGQRPGHHQPPEQRSDRPVRAAMDPRPGPAARTHSFENHRAT